MEMAAEKGYAKFIERDSSSLKIEIDGQVEVYDNLKFFDFDSARKMMTRVVRSQSTGQVYAFAKGADSAIISRCVSRSYDGANPLAVMG